MSNFNYKFKICTLASKSVGKKALKRYLKDSNLSEETPMRVGIGVVAQRFETKKTIIL